MARTGNPDCRLDAFSPWGKLPLLPRNEISVGSASEPASVRFDPRDVPFLPIWPDTLASRFNGSISNRGAIVCMEKAFPKTEKEFPRER